MKAVFIDANILLDLIDKNRTRHLKSKEVLKKLLLDEYRLGISEDMFSNIYYVSKRAKVDNVKLLEFLEFWRSNAEILSFGKDTIGEAIAYCKENLDSDSEDVMQAMCALKHKFDYILTEDLSFTKSFIENKNLDEIQNIFKY